ncbi:MAG: hypothetical protein HON68_02570 [Gammaproteobacteria bacterium]|nr:hypothetical protein [Gammaproteobacteria bacterium]MBT3488941.1 hypothetical protein [Gammaproteobacteria bacterium]MBT3719386.1 hypothetical protein [Gammaproteobacteria bacterium]MBT3844567.1 hypothetical protein [Gammaproteobacteria bacterium]MBT3893764.1 hypothetical protein [Gammaproteobacteria bacterium]
MVEARATVVAIDAEYTWVETRRQGGCGGCEGEGSCGVSTLSKVIGKRASKVPVENPLNAKTGDEVTISLSENGLITATAKLYLLPLLLLFGSFLLVDQLLAQWSQWQQEWLVLVLALAVTALALGWMKREGMLEQKGVVPVITEIHERNIVSFNLNKNS